MYIILSFDDAQCMITLLALFYTTNSSELSMIYVSKV
jgi:hypothetical protein